MAATAISVCAIATLHLLCMSKYWMLKTRALLLCAWRVCFFFFVFGYRKERTIQYKCIIMWDDRWTHGLFNWKWFWWTVRMLVYDRRGIVLRAEKTADEIEMEMEKVWDIISFGFHWIFDWILIPFGRTVGYVMCLGYFANNQANRPASTLPAKTRR